MYGAGGLTGNNVDATCRRTRSRGGGAEIVYYTVISLTLATRPTSQRWCWRRSLQAAGRWAPAWCSLSSMRRRLKHIGEFLPVRNCVVYSFVLDSSFNSPLLVISKPKIAKKTQKMLICSNSVFSSRKNRERQHSAFEYVICHSCFYMIFYMILRHDICS